MSNTPKGLCKGICEQYRAKKPTSGLGRYASGQVRCQVCDIFMTRDGCHDKDGKPVNEDSLGLYCNCCNYRVTSRPRSKFYNEQFKNFKETQSTVEKSSEPNTLKTLESNLENIPLDFEEVKIFILEDIRPQANYQFVVIKTLLESGFKTTRENIVKSLEFYNKDKPYQDYSNSVVFTVLQNRNIIIKEDDDYRLNLESDLYSMDVLELISLCNEKIYENKKYSNQEYFIALGPWENWFHTIDNLPLRWGVAETTLSNIAVFNLLKEGDVVFYYSTKDDSAYFSERGFFGAGIVTKTTINKDEKYWPEEQKTDKSFYTHKLYLDTIKFVQTDNDLLPIVDGLPLVKGLNHVNPGESLNRLLENARNKWNILRGDIPTQTVNYWKIAPGKQAEDWETQRKLGLIGIGWNEVGTLKNISLDAIREKLRMYYPDEANNVPQFKNFLSIKKGDVVIANNGKSKIVGVGRVIGDYQFRPELKYAHTYPVDWFYVGQKEIPIQNNWFVTVQSVSEELYKMIMSNVETLPKSDDIFEELIQKFDKDRKLFDLEWNADEEKETLRSGFISRFPMDKIQDIKLDDYVAGKPDPQTGGPNRFTFCNMLEGHQLDNFGSIWGSYAQKFGIFFGKEKNDYVYPPSYASANEAFQEIKNQIGIVLTAGKKFESDNDWQQLSNVIDNRENFDIQRNIRSKLLAVYFPKYFLTIHKKAAIDKILDYLGIPRQNLRGKLTLKQARLIEFKESHPIMKNWSVSDYSHFLWNVIVQGSEDLEEEETESITTPTTSHGNYLLLRHNPGFKRKGDRVPWNDKLGREYHYGKTVANYTKINPNSKTVWFYTDKDNLYFWGFGIVQDVRTESDGKFTSTLRNFHYFDDQYNSQSSEEPSAIKAPFLIQQQIKKLSGWNPFNSIIEIDEHIYDQILGSEHLENTFENQLLPFPSPEILKSAKEEIKEEILVNDDTLDQIISTLLSGKNILLVGPVGSGKTHLASILPEIVWKEFGGYYSQVYTATADWTTQDVIGGIYPKLDESDQVIYDIQKGCVSETVSQNWLNESSYSGKRLLVERTRNGETRRYRGIWLVIDEFNRANIDRAFGQLFTALEYKNLQIPTTDKERPYEDLVIPEDYRIIGTLNTADKHFLHTLSDALKRRFAIIELSIPTFEQKQNELYYVVKKALKDLENTSTTIKVDESKKEIIPNSDPEAIKILETLYLLMTYIREIKPLGTALLISMFRFMITSHTLTDNWQKSLDLALTSNVLPQLENLPYWSLKVTRSVFCSDPGQFFKNDPEVLRDGYENYRTDFEHLFSFLKKIKPLSSGVLKRFRSSSLTDEDFTSLTPWSAETVRPGLPNFARGITKLIEEKGFTEESELNE